MHIDAFMLTREREGNSAFLKVGQDHWKMATPEHLEPHDPGEQNKMKLKFIGAMITTAGKKLQSHDEGSSFVCVGSA
eukprot:12937709-Prorocentrum_lima.AAC.1